MASKRKSIQLVPCSPVGRRGRAKVDANFFNTVKTDLLVHTFEQGTGKQTRKMARIQEMAIAYLLQIPFEQRTKERIRSDLDMHLWNSTVEIDEETRDAIIQCIPMPTKEQVYKIFLEAVKTNLSNLKNPTLLQVCYAVDDEMKTYPTRGSEYEIVRTRIINELDSEDDICEACGCRVDVPVGSVFLGKYCSSDCWGTHARN